MKEIMILCTRDFIIIIISREKNKIFIDVCIMYKSSKYGREKKREIKVGCFLYFMRAKNNLLFHM